MPFRLLSRFLLALGSALPLAAATDDPRLSSWLTAPAGAYARLYQSDAAKSAGTVSTTWSRGQTTQSSPAYAGVTQVSSSTDWVYLRSTGLGYHVMGPWYIDAARTQNFPNFPGNTRVLYRIPRTPTVPSSKTLTGGGAIGYFVDGVAMFDNRDSFSYVAASGQDATPINGLQGDGVWSRDAYTNEGITFDAALAHQAGSQYHYHANTPALRYLLGDHVTYDSATKTYPESTAAVTTHSPILGWAADGHPVYGPYGYASPMDATSGVRRMVSGYVMRNGANGTTNLSTTGRTTLPAWAARAQARSATLGSAVHGPNVSATYALGHYIEDYDHLGDLGVTQGTSYDLDVYNGRTCVTPEFPGGTYAYFLAIEADGSPKFPYILGRWYYGNPTGGAVTAIGETVTEYVRGAPAADLKLTATAAGGGVALRWNSAEGATYRVESSADASSWTTLAGAVTSAGSATEYAATLARVYRVTLTAIATYDTGGTVGTPVGTTGTVTYETTPTAPAILSGPASVAAAAGDSVTFSVTAGGTAPLAYQWKKDGVAVTGATASSLTLASVAAADAGSYTVTVSNTAGAATSGAAVLTIGPATVRLVNLSMRASAGGTAGTPIVGFVLTGSDARQMLVRAIGPALAQLQISGPLADPSVSLVSGGVTLASNDNWLAADAATFAEVGAFSLTTNSRDAALVTSLSPGVFSAPVGQGGGSGVVLLEVYDADAAETASRLVNLSSRAYVGTGEQVLIAGFVVTGTGSVRLLVRGVGPGLTAQGVTDALANPQLTVYRGSTALATNDDWSTATEAAAVASAAQTTGAFALTADSKDAALLVSLPAGVYTAVVSGVDNATGTALVELYLVP